MFKAAVFDAYGTLFKLPESNELLQELIGERSNELLRYWRQKQLAYTWQRTLMNRYAPFEKVSEDALRHTLDVFGLENKALYEDLMQTLWQPELFPEVKGVLTDLTN
ncbi:MAG: haloacid dehalogenase, partial [Bacteroidota bacterium]